MSTNTVCALEVPPPPTLTSTEYRHQAARSPEQQKQQMVDQILRTDLIEAVSAVEVSAEQTNEKGYIVRLPNVASLKAGHLPVPPHRHQGLPRARLSAASALVGRHWVLFGGFSVSHSQMGDAWVSQNVKKV